MVQSRPQFGFLGALLVWVVALGYAAIGIVLAIVGYDFIHRAQRWLTAVMIAALLIFSVGILVVSPFTAEQLNLHHFALTLFLIQFFTAAVYQLSWSIYVSDY
ncbi:hypothetical protein KO481_36200 [Nocardia sp. NEAU-G5]|uniref:Uncharacterized protein n=1 Tax=Nocardia albiluteola TaxID=2842303 RepID=A0ABS6B9H7_9NOCA|nr:hypothetical protein [Nocardia albiluteola]MBU3066952.1 hypothetical protein [Nocardia albiluteola]